jgi:alkylhydroperoxidase family enzyme
MAGALIGAHRTVMNYRLLAGMTRYDSLVERLRQAAQPDRQAPPDFAPYLGKVRRNAYEVTDEDIQALKDAGYSEDVIFEQTVSVAVAAGLERLEAGLKVLP